MHYANQGEFVRKGSGNQTTSYCVSVYESNDTFDNLPKSRETPFWCDSEHEALEFVQKTMKEKPGRYTYVIRKLQVTHF